MADQSYFSLVIPAYNEQENVEPLLNRVAAALGQLGASFEVIIVDDGSTDATPQLLADAKRKYPWLRVLRLARNSGQTVAFDAGFKAARGQVIGTIDAERRHNNLSSAVRLFVLNHYQMRSSSDRIIESAGYEANRSVMFGATT